MAVTTIERRRKRTAGIILAAIALAAVGLGFIQWDQQREGPVAHADKPIPPPPNALQAPSVERVNVWEPNAARNSRDLHAAFETARAQNRADAWLVAADIVDFCFATGLDNGPADRVTQEIGELNSTRTTDPDRVAKLALLKQQQAARSELAERCKGFSGKGRPWVIATATELRTKAEQSDSDVGRLMRATAASHAGKSSEEFVPAVSTALASGNPVLTRMALLSLIPSLFDRRIEGAPPFAAVDALLTAQLRLVGVDFFRNDLDTLSSCAVGGCEIRLGLPPPPDWSDAQRAQWDAVVKQYEDALRAQDVRKIVAVAP